jgi:hypothetical protein
VVQEHFLLGPWEMVCAFFDLLSVGRIAEAHPLD